MSIDKDKLLDLLLYAVNKANEWHDDASGGPIQSQEMAQCIAVLAASGRSPRDYEDARALLDSDPDRAEMFAGWKTEDFKEFLLGMNKILQEPVQFYGQPAVSIRTGLPVNTWRRIKQEVADGQ